MTTQDAELARTGDLVEASDGTWAGTVVKAAPEMGAVAVRVDDPGLTGREPGTVLPFALAEVELLMRGDR